MCDISAEDIEVINDLKVIVIGAGFAGACAAWMLRDRVQADVTILEQESVPGGMLRTLYNEDGLAYEYGPRVVSVFRGTPDALLFLRSFVELQEREIYQGTRLRPDFPVIPFPVDRTSLKALPCGAKIERELYEITQSEQPARDGNLKEYLESSLGPTLTELAFEGFNQKFWGRRLDEMPAEWGKLRRLERIASEGAFRLPSTAPHYYPTGGFNGLFEKMLDGFDVRYGCRVTAVDEGDGITVFTETESFRPDVVISTAPIDAIFDYRFGPLEWRGYRLEVETASADSAGLGRASDGVPFSWIYTPWPETPVCRTTDFRVIHQGRSHQEPGVVSREIPDDSVRMYPVWWDQAKLDLYLEATSGVAGLLPLGRLGLYKYVTIDTTYAMVERLVGSLERYLAGNQSERLDLLRMVRGDWQD